MGLLHGLLFFRMNGFQCGFCSSALSTSPTPISSDLDMYRLLFFPLLLPVSAASFHLSMFSVRVNPGAFLLLLSPTSNIVKLELIRIRIIIIRNRIVDLEGIYKDHQLQQPDHFGANEKLKRINKGTIQTALEF